MEGQKDVVMKRKAAAKKANKIATANVSVPVSTPTQQSTASASTAPPSQQPTPSSSTIPTVAAVAFRPPGNPGMSSLHHPIPDYDT